MNEEVLLLKGNEAIAHAAVRCGCDGYFGYPITPQSEVLETLAEIEPWKTTGMIVLQAESEVASINMLYGGGGTGKRVMTSSSSPGIAVMQEGISYMAGAEIPGLIGRRVAVEMETMKSLCLLPLRCKRWQTSWTWLLNLLSNIATPP